MTSVSSTQNYSPFNAKREAKLLRTDFESNSGNFFTKLAKIENEHLCNILMHLPGEIFEQAFKRIPHQRLAAALTFVESDDQTDFMKRMKKYDASFAEKTLPLLHIGDQQDIEKLSKYTEEQAGAVMITELVSANLNETLRSVKTKVRKFRRNEPNIPVNKLYVVDDDNNLIASLSYASLFIFEAEQTLEEILQSLKPKKPFTVFPETPLNEVLKLFEEYSMSGMAVVDHDGKLVGRIIYKDVYQSIRIQEQDQALKMVGADDEAEEESFHAARRSRLHWLLINLVAILASSFIISLFEDTLEQLVALAILMPVVAALGGNVGNQAVTVTVRKLAMGEIDWNNAYPVIKREISIGVLNGLVLGILVAIIAYIWFQKPELGLVIGFATLINLTIAGLIGSMVPLLIKKIGSDPAIAAPLLLTTATDALGFLVFLGLATMVLL